jgi:6-phosphogluconolactonase
MPAVAVSPEVLVGAPEALADALARRVEACADAARAEARRFAIALPGGSVAARFFPRLATAAVDWTEAEFFWGDERAVPPDHPDSNYGLAVTTWLGPAGIRSERAHRMPADAEDLQAASEGHEQDLVRLLGTPPRLDVALLGMGPDGHVCSLFPGHPLLHEERAFVAPVFDSPKPPPRRMTLTLPALRSARLVVLAALGSAKAPAVRAVLDDPASQLPAALALRGAAAGLVLVDPAARGTA